MHLSEILTHFGEDRSAYFQAVAPPVIQSSNFVFTEFADMRRQFSNELAHHVYSRGNNPTVEILRKKLAALECAEDSLVFSSGVAAIAAAIMANVQQGDHIICVKSPYSWTHTLLTRYLPRFGVSHTFVDGRDQRQIADAVQPNTRILYLESPNTMLFELQDLRACADLAKAHNLLTICDNSCASPIFQRPIEHGVDIVVHSGTKYLNGHSDVVLGVLCSKASMVKRIFETEFMTIGGILQAHDAGLVIRGLRTLELRMRRSHESALTITSRLEMHPKVRQVNCPFAAGFPQRDLALRQMQGCGGLFSVIFDADSVGQMEAFISRLKRFLIAVSWGGYESLVMPMAGFYGIPGRPDPSLPLNLVRFYIGLEDADWLWEDIEQALVHL
jgi:cystathionine beta-lyase/cystathionine gamma-synthase